MIKVETSKKEEKELYYNIDEFLNRLNKNLKNAKAILGGSVAKGTWLPKNYDVDIFVLYPSSFNKKNISKMLFNPLEKSFKKIEKVKGSRDYFRVYHKNFTFEVIPILKIKSAKGAFNITDISPFHSKWVKENINNLANEIRLAKIFCKANKIYGAESHIQGFSGYVLEILVIFYGSFEKLLKASRNWKIGELIDIKKHKEELNKSKLSPLLVIDPVQADRNAAAALSLESFNKFKDLSKKYFLKKNKEEFFKEKKFSLKNLKGFVVIKLEPKYKGKENIIGSKLLKLHNKIKKQIDIFGFRLTDYGWEFGIKKTYFWYKAKNISKRKKHYGPFLNQKSNVKEFKEKWKDFPIKTEKNKMYVSIERKHTSLNSFLREFIGGNRDIIELSKSFHFIKT